MSETSELELIARARSYVAASNDHDAARIEPMLADDCVYESSGVGRHEGLSAIVAMMRDFFAANPKVNWQPSNYRLRDEACVEFDFVIDLGDSTSEGVERLYFDGSGRISRIEVRR